MLAVPHVLVGGAIGKRVKWPYVALPLAFAGHFLLDMVPHVDTVTFFGIGGLKSGLAIAADALAAAVPLLILARGQERRRWIIWGGVAAVITDVIVMVPLWFNSAAGVPVLRHICRLHALVAAASPPCGWPLGVATQVLTLALATFFLFPRRPPQQIAGVPRVPGGLGA